MECPPRFGTPRSPERATLGPAVGLLAAMLGTPLMEWQQYVADVILEIDPETGELAYDEYGLTVPRQSGKTTLILAKASHRCSAGKFFGTEQQVSYTAQTKLKATDKFEKEFARAIGRANRLKARIRTGNVKVDIRYPNGSVFGVESGTEKSGHGSVLDEAFIDEAFSQQDNRMEQAFEPAMITRRNKQLGVTSTAGWLDASPYLWGKVTVGRKLVQDGVRHGTAYFEWSAPDDADPGDEQVWLATMPALHRPDCPKTCKRHTVAISTIRSLHDKAVRSGKMSDFCRAYLNQWKTKPKEAQETALGDWASCVIPMPEVEPEPFAIGAACSLDREWASIGAAAEITDGRILLAQVTRREGTGWVAEELVRIQQERNCPIVMAAKGPLSDLIAKVEELGGNVTQATFEDFAHASAAIADGVRDKTVAHVNHVDLNNAVEGARWRFHNDRRILSRRDAETDGSMLEAVTLAMGVRPSVYEKREMVIL